MEDLRYPIGEYIVQPFSEKLWKERLSDIRYLPQHIENAIHDLDEHQLQTPYRDGGWTVHQLVHHVADSHMNAYIRFKLGMTEANPTIKPYDEAAWAVLPDSAKLPINISLTILHAVHTRWQVILDSMTKEQLDRSVLHPEYKKEFRLWDLLGLYAW